MKQVCKSKTLRKSGFLLFALLCAFIVGFFGWYQFSSKPSRAIELVRGSPIPGTDMTIGEGIEDFLQRKGIEVVRKAFKPRWGAEEIRKNIFKVSFVYEVGREANWISWEVDLHSNTFKPLGKWASELTYGKSRKETY